MLRIGRGLGLVQRFEVVARGDALRQLAQVGAPEHLAQFRLPDQHDLEQLLRGGFEVGQQPHLFQGGSREILCLVDQDHDGLAFRVRLQQKLVEPIRKLLRVAPGGARVHPELFADRLQQLGRFQQWIENQCSLDLTRKILQKEATDRCLAGADFPGQLHEPPAAAGADAVAQMGQCVLVAVAQEDEPRIRRNRERRRVESEMLQIHGGLDQPVGLAFSPAPGDWRCRRLPRY